MEDRRSFLEKMSTAGILSLLPISSVWATIPNDEKNTFSAGPYLQNLTPSEVTIVWITKKNSFSWVEYGDGAHLSMREFGYSNGLIEANNLINKVTLRNLKPGTQHKYRIVSTEITGYRGSTVVFGETINSALLGFKTPQVVEDEIKCVLFNDIHDRPQIIPQLLYRHGYTGNNRDYDFVVFNGDCFDQVSSETQIINHLLKPTTDLFSNEIPFILTQGNHECRGSFARQVPNYFAYPDNKYYFSFTRGPVHFLVLDSGEDKTDNSVEYGGLTAFDRYRDIQKEWLEKEIESPAFKKAAFRVLIIHISPWHSGDWHGTLHCRKTFGPLLNKAKIDLQLSGHTHKYMTHPADENHNFPIMIGGGPIEGNRTLIKLHANQKEMNILMVRDDGEQVGKLKISKK
jgi:hypothetical protein